MMAVIVAIDGATRSGVAVAEPSSGIPKMELFTWQAPEKRPIQEKIEYLVEHLIRLIGNIQVLYAAVEIPQSGIGSRRTYVETPDGIQINYKLGGNAGTQAQLWAMHGAYVGVLHSHDIQYRGVGVREWRKAILGNGNMKKDEAKKASRDMCFRLGIDAKNNDTAEAAMILLYANGNYRRWLVEDGFKNL
jgi:Holliday junction resolvasome RuvABC endonuclease subunit